MDAQVFRSRTFFENQYPSQGKRWLHGAIGIGVLLLIVVRIMTDRATGFDVFFSLFFAAAMLWPLWRGYHEKLIIDDEGIHYIPGPLSVFFREWRMRWQDVDTVEWAKGGIMPDRWWVRLTAGQQSHAFEPWKWCLSQDDHLASQQISESLSGGGRRKSAARAEALFKQHTFFQVFKEKAPLTAPDWYEKGYEYQRGLAFDMEDHPSAGYVLGGAFLLFGIGFLNAVWLGARDGEQIFLITEPSFQTMLTILAICSMLVCTWLWSDKVPGFYCVFFSFVAGLAVASVFTPTVVALNQWMATETVQPVVYEVVADDRLVAINHAELGELDVRPRLLKSRTEGERIELQLQKGGLGYYQLRYGTFCQALTKSDC